MNVVYIQCDCRFNKWLLETINNKYVIDYTIEKCRMLSSKIVAGVFDCPENKKLIDRLYGGGVEIVSSKEENVSKRFMDIVTEFKDSLVIRVSGDQCLTDIDKVKDILCEMEKNEELDWYMDRVSNSVLPDIVRVRCLNRYRAEIECADRYFDALEKIPEAKKYKLPYPILLPYNFRANSNCNFRVCKYIIEKDKDMYEVAAEMLRNMVHTDSYLTRTGLLASWIMRADDFYYDDENKVNPWLGRTVIDVIKKHLNNTLNVFEWGMGNSTLFWSQYVNYVISVDHDKDWYEKVKKIVPQNAECRWVELEYGGSYCKEIFNTETEFDIIMIDGRDRVQCAINAVNKLKTDGVIVWDNTERDYYNPGIAFLKEKGFKQLELYSVLYGSPGYGCYTSIFYRNENIFGL